MSVVVDSRIPPIPNENAYHVAGSLASLQPTASGLVHLMGWRFRRLVTAFWTCDDSAGTGYQDSTWLINTTRYLRWTCSPLAEYAHVTFTYQARADVTGGASVAVYLYDTAGALQDGPVTFDEDDGTLPTRTLSTRVFIGAVDEYPHLTVHTGTRTRLIADDRIGLINVPSAVRGADVELRLVCTSVRVRSVTVWEWPTLEIG